jgi:hypothetical protein
LAGSILFALGIVVLVAGVVVVNNIISKYWKPVRIFTPDSWKAFNPPHSYVEPRLDETHGKEKTS